MAELELVTLHEDAERLVLRGPGGEEHTLAISEALRAAVRRDRPRTEALQAEAETTLRPREIQVRLRAGATVEDLAAESGLPLEHVRRYEWPVAAERNHVVERVRTHRVDTEQEVTLGELADARLAARGVDAADAHWSARREGNRPWQVAVRFSAGGRERDARWAFDPKGRVVTALDDEARWLAQPDDPVSPEILGVPSRLDRTPPRRTPVPGRADDETAELLDDLAGRRGQRPHRGRAPDRGPQDDELPLDLQPTGAQPPDARPRPADGASVVDLGARRDAQRSGSDDATSAATDPAGDPSDTRSTAPTGDAAPTADQDPSEASTDPDDDRAEEPTPVAEAPAPDPDRSGPETGATSGAEHSTAPPRPAAVTTEAAPRGAAAARRPARKGRAQMPSWDEIVFGGARPSS